MIGISPVLAYTGDTSLLFMCRPCLGPEPATGTTISIVTICLCLQATGTTISIVTICLCLKATESATGTTISIVTICLCLQATGTTISIVTICLCLQGNRISHRNHYIYSHYLSMSSRQQNQPPEPATGTTISIVTICLCLQDNRISHRNQPPEPLYL